MTPGGFLYTVTCSDGRYLQFQTKGRVYGNCIFTYLDCVHHALDALEDHQSIDKSRIGLFGFSHGGYETNFIATHSDRFAAYIAGAGNSDIARSYFSYNNNFWRPFYWEQTMEFYIGLKRNRKKVVALFYPKEGHAFFSQEACRDLSLRIQDWLDYYLKGKKETEWIGKADYVD